MKKSVKRFWAFVCCVAFSAVFCLSSSAASANEYGLGLCVNCEEAAAGAVANIKLKNSNSFDVEGVSLSAVTADGLLLVSGEDAQNIGTLKAGEAFETALSFESLVEQVAVEIPQPEAAVQAKENVGGQIAAALAAVLLIIAAVVILMKKNKKAAALMLAVTVMLPFVGMFSVHAVGLDEAKSFTLEANITVDGREYPLTVKVDYTASTAKNSYFEFDTAPEAAEKDGQTVTRLTTDFSGTAAANEAVKTVTYEIKSEIDGYENSVTGEAVLDGCDWSADSLALKPGKNEITFTAELENGTTQTQTYELTYDRGELYEYKPEEVKEENGIQYVENVINIYFDVNTADERIAQILAEQSLAQIGEINDIRMVQTRTLAADLDELNEKMAELEEYDEVVLACAEQLVELESNTVPDDTWDLYGDGHTETWDESMPGGYNWHVEAIQAPSAWNYDKYYNAVTLGVVDGGFKTDHEDYDDLIHFTSTTYQNGNDSTSLHGTHVAGIIGAAANNGKGITGLLWNVDIYGATYTTGGSNTVTNVVNAVSAQVASGAKVINLSLGLSNAYDATTNPNPYLNPYTESELAAYAKPCAVGMDSLLDQNFEFVVVQSAGNGVVDSRIGIASYRSADARQNGLYCSILEDGSYGSLSAADVKAVYDRILVAGAVRNKSNDSNGLKMNMWERGNSGDRVDIYAPGVTVYSTIADYYDDGVLYTYGGMTGTSQAAPIVTAVAGLCFAINPDFTGAQVKAIICDEANYAYVAHDYSLTTTLSDGTVLDYHPFEGDGKVINMKLCAEAALRTVCGKASYTYLNRIVAAAQSLDPDAYTNYDIVQAVIDSIDYNLYAFEQDKVTAKANELIAAMDKLEDKTAADYTKVDEAVAKANALDPSHYVDFSGVTAAVNAVVYGKYSDEQEAVNQMAQDILDAIDALELACSVSSGDSEVVPDNSKQIIVISPEKTDTLLTCLDAGGYTVSFSANGLGVYSTGSKVLLSDSDDSTSDIVYTVVAVGDTNGDGFADGEDAMEVNLCVKGVIEPSDVYFYAYDADCDGSITSGDVELLEQVGLMNDVIINFYEPEAAA